MTRLTDEEIDKWIEEIRRHSGISCGSDEIIPLLEELIFSREEIDRLKRQHFRLVRDCGIPVDISTPSTQAENVSKNSEKINI